MIFIKITYWHLKQIWDNSVTMVAKKKKITNPEGFWLVYGRLCALPATPWNPIWDQLWQSDCSWRQDFAWWECMLLCNSPLGSTAPCHVMWLLLGCSTLTCTRPISRWVPQGLQWCKEVGACCGAVVESPLAGTTMETFAWKSFVPRHFRYLGVQCVVIGHSRCLELKTNGDAEGEEMPKVCSPK